MSIIGEDRVRLISDVQARISGLIAHARARTGLSYFTCERLVVHLARQRAFLIFGRGVPDDFDRMLSDATSELARKDAMKLENTETTQETNDNG